LTQHRLCSRDELAFSLVGLVELTLVAGLVLLILSHIPSYVVDIDAFGVTIVETLGCHSSIVLAIDVLSEKPVDVACVSWNMLSLELVSGAADPGCAVLDVVVIWDLFGCVHCSYICLFMYHFTQHHLGI
jgi:hypothetical protein